jgi:hypothetical protein
MGFVLGHKGTMAQGTKAQPTLGNNPFQDQVKLMVTLMVLIMIDRCTCE